MKKIKYLILFCLIPLISGCYNYRELNDIGIVTAISIDYKDNNFNIIAQVVNPIKAQDSANSNEPNFIIYKSSASSLSEALRKVILDSPRQLYGPHLQLLILSEEVANNHIGEVIEYMTREIETRFEYKILIAKNNESLDSISLQLPLSDLSSSNILDSLELQGKELGLTVNVTLNELTNMYLNPYLEITLPSVIVKGDTETGKKEENKTETEQTAKIYISTTAIFKGNALLGYLTEEQSFGLNFINGNINTTIIKVEEDSCYTVFEPTRIKSGSKANVKENKVTTEIKGTAKIIETTCSNDIDNPKEIGKLEKKLNEKIKSVVLKTFNDIRSEYNTDVFGFADLYYRSDAKYFKDNYRDNWYDETFSNLNYTVKAKIKLYEKGTTLRGAEYERKNK